MLTAAAGASERYDCSVCSLFGNLGQRNSEWYLRHVIQDLELSAVTWHAVVACNSLCLPIIKKDAF